MKTNIDYYKAGHDVGLTWDKDWNPAGPWFCMCKLCREQSIKDQTLWQHGFKNGQNSH